MNYSKINEIFLVVILNEIPGYKILSDDGLNYDRIKHLLLLDLQNVK